MGAITIKIPQNTDRTFEITDRETAEKLLRELGRPLAPKKKPSAKKAPDFSELSKWMEEQRNNPDAETIYAIKTAAEWRKRWDR